MRQAKRLLVIAADNPYLRHVFKGIHDYSRIHGNWEFHHEGDRGVDSPDTIKRSEMAIRNWKADGIIAHIRSDRIERLVRKSGLPVVNLSSGRETDLPTVIIDGAAVGKMVARHFLERGLRNFAFYAKTVEVYSHVRCAGFLEELAGAGHKAALFTDRFAGVHESNWVQSRRRMGQWLKSLKKPLGLMCTHDTYGREAITTCVSMGLRVPDDVAIVGMGNEPFLCEFCAPPLSSVDIPAPRIGYEAARLMDRLLHNAPVKVRQILITPRCVVTRQSSDMIATTDPDIKTAMQFIRDHAHEPINVKDLLQVVPICRKTMDVRFMKAIGRTPAVEITRVHIERAKSLLAETDLLVPAIAQASGFTSRVIFAAVFRRQTGLSPTQYRRNSRMDAGIPAVQVT